MSNLGRHGQALEAVDRALKLDPLSSFNGAMKGQFLFCAGRYPQAIEHMHKALELEPNFWIGQLVLGRSYQSEERYEEALAAFRKAKQFSDGSAAVSLIGYTHAVAGRREEAERTLRELRAISKKKYVPPYNIALLYHGLGNSDETLRWLERAYEERDVRMVFLGVDPNWDALRTDRRFIDLLARMKLPKDRALHR